MSFDLIRNAWAAAPVAPPNNPLPQFDSLATVLGFAMQVVFYVGIALTVIFLIIGGIRYVTSGGDKAGAEAARSNITNAILGFIVVIGAFAIRIVLQNVLGTTEALPVVPAF